MNLSSVAPCPATLASELAESVQYRGRQASRQGSEQRRLSILEATLRIIVREGLRGVRHRAVAAEAQVPLSATTYYFSDIQDLVADSFTLFVKRSSTSLAALWAGVDEDFYRIAAAIEQDPNARREMVTHFIDLAVAHVQAKMREHDDELLVELAFRQEALTNTQLRPLFLAHQSLRLRFAERALRIMGSTAPLEDAQVLTTLVLRMEYHAIVDGAQDFDLEAQRAVLQRFLDLVIGA
ncbi:TetR/AcrR family transcriptional regulator [Pseudomonas sp. Gutcm_11s]|uniref:TetR/AcrR family transcriptional regulator n=1 Tax=Pseudomonas sp. Gutcm_11s TaxID=3026088 RepID=UPI002360B685|nr:TetR family transcriptional regulator [Pseudomonas sp. Gutcm_11s]MDD0841849.1 TetR family transcriptional regulator [Pseudomonas sp. Gutcm_11s]